MDIRRWDDIEGWSHDIVCLYDVMVERATGGERFVELGTWLGRSTAFMASRIRNSKKKIKFFAADHGVGSHELAHTTQMREHVNVAAVAIDNLHKCDLLKYVTYIAGDSLDVADLFPSSSLDFIMLDDRHDGDHVLEEIYKWLPKLKLGGIIAGHDATPQGSGHFPTLLRAVQSAFGVTDPRIKPLEDWNSCWGFTKTMRGFKQPDFTMSYPNQIVSS